MAPGPTSALDRRRRPGLRRPLDDQIATWAPCAAASATPSIRSCSTAPAATPGSTTASPPALGLTPRTAIPLRLDRRCGRRGVLRSAVVGQGRVPLSQPRRRDLLRGCALPYRNAQPPQRSGRRELSLLRLPAETASASVPKTGTEAFCLSGSELGAADCCCQKTRQRKQSVDDSHAALEIPRRSSYVPTFNHRRLIPALAGNARPTWRAPARLEMPIWMKCSGRSANLPPAPHRAR